MAKRRRHSFFDEAFLARLERLHLIAKRMSGLPRSGVRRSRRIGDGLEFADHRAYSPGDDIRFIDWPYYARMERLMLRLFHEHSEAGVEILLDCSASMSPGGAARKFDYARRAAAALAYIAMGSMERVTVQPFAGELGDSIHTGPSRAGIFDVLDFLGGIEPAGKTALAACAETLVRRSRAPATTILVGDLLDCADDLSLALARIRARHSEVVVLHVYSPADAAPKLAGPAQIEQAETRERMNVDVNRDMAEAYRAAWAGFQAECERTCLSRRAVYVAAPCDVPLDELILRSLRRAGVLAE